MAYLAPEWTSETDDSIEVDDEGPVIPDDDALVNSKGASVNYVAWDSYGLGAFCADKSSLKG